MKKIKEKNIIIGYGSELKSVTKSMWRAWREGHTDWTPLFCDVPKFNSEKIYGVDLKDGTILTAEDIIIGLYDLKSPCLEEIELD